MRIFVNNVDGFLGGAICADLYQGSNNIFGTRKKHDGNLVPPCIKRLVMRTDVRKLLKVVASCDVVVYDLHDADMEELELVLRALHSSEITHQMTFILVSSVGVWSRTQRTYETLDVAAEEGETPAAAADDAAAEAGGDAEAPAADVDAEGAPASAVETGMQVARRPMPLKSEDYTRRIPAPKFQEWKTIETTALALREKGTVRPYVVCAGLPYGNGEDCFLSLFKAAWQSKDTLRIIGDGSNYLPCVHARDCARLVRRIVETRPELEYHLAVDRGDITQKEVIQAVASEFSVGYDVQSVTVPEALLAELADVLTMDLRLEPSPIMEPTKIEEPVDEEAAAVAPPEEPPAEENAAEEDAEGNLLATIKPPVNFRWWSEKGLANNIATVVTEFIRWRCLKPVRILLFGPPGSGVGKLAEKVAQRYCVYNASVENVAEQLKSQESKLGDSVRDMLDQIAAAMGNPKAAGPFQIPAALATQILEEEVLPKPSTRFRGFVLSGFPTTSEEAAEFFLQDAPPPEPPAEGEEPRPAEEQQPGKILRPSVAPDIVVVLSSSEEACQQRTQEREPPMADKEFEIKMGNWKKAFPEEGVKLTDIFGERGITPLTLEIDEANEDELCEQVATHLESVRHVNSFRVVPHKKSGESREQAKEAEPVQDEGAAQKEANNKKKQTEERERLEAIKKEEFTKLEKHSEHLRQYLMQFVVPTLTTGLIDVCRETPEDPVAYLAEYLSSYSTQMVAVRRKKRQAAMASPPLST